MTGLPYKIAVLCYLHDPQDRLLLLHRIKNPNAGMYSPIGGKLEVALGESPHTCAQREIREETGLDVSIADLHLQGIVAETAYEGSTHWLIFLFELLPPVEPGSITAMEFDEGRLEWVPRDAVADLTIPETDRKVMWPLVQAHRGGFFAVDIDCTQEPFRWTVQESHPGPAAG